jgi:hypothetical protein
MVGEPDDITVDGWYFDEENTMHIALHFLEPADILAAWRAHPLYFRNLPGRTATHVMVGEDSKGRLLYAVILETDTIGMWKVISAWESRFVRRLWRNRGVSK